MDITEVKQNLNRKVHRCGFNREYVLTGCILRKSGGKYFYQAELFDQSHGNSVVICDLEELEKN